MSNFQNRVELIEDPFLGIFGSKRINVLLLNKKLDDKTPR